MALRQYVVKYGDGKIYSDECLTKEQADAILADALEQMDHDNWCDLHIEPRNVSLQEYIELQAMYQK